ncbi:MAG TPA: urate oxidase [Edaphobacter sp.]|nr:urate oxidase [Edaphobacter sp.]
MITLGDNRYGKSRVRVMKVDRSNPRHRVYEWNVEVWLRGDFIDCFEKGDNSRILPTDTIKNTVYSLARSSGAESIEEFATDLATNFIADQPQVEEAGVRIHSAAWTHITVGGKEHGSAFVQSGRAAETTTVVYPRNGPTTVTSGITDLAILKTAKSAFAGYIRDRLTTLKETNDRLLGTLATAEWTYTSPPPNFNEARARITDALLESFALHDSMSVQQTLFAMGKAALNAESAVNEIYLKMPNKHCNLVDLSAFGQDNPNVIFVPTDEPHGSIEACVRREP